MGKHKKAGYSTACVCLFVFDMMHYNGQDLSKKTLKERRKILEDTDVLVPIECRVQLSEMKVRGCVGCS
jgi:DNA ligase-3